MPGRMGGAQKAALMEEETEETKKLDTHDTLPFFEAIFFPHRKVRFLPSATSLVLVRGGAGVAATVGKGNSGGGERGVGGVKVFLQRGTSYCRRLSFYRTVHKLEERLG